METHRLGTKKYIYGRFTEEAGIIVFGVKDKADKDDTKTQHVYHRLMEMTNGRGPDRCIDAAGTEAHVGGSIDSVVDRAKMAVFLGTDRAHVRRGVIFCCRKGGTVSIPGVYIGMIDKFPFGAAMNKGLTLKMGQTHMHRYMKPLLEHIERGEIDPSFVVTHRISWRKLRRCTKPSGTRRMVASRWSSSRTND